MRLLLRTKMNTTVEKSALAAAARLFRSMGATQVFVFGSAATGRMTASSDVDMAVSGLPPNLYFSAVSQASDLLNWPVDLVDLEDRTPIIQYLLHSGELIRAD